VISDSAELEHILENLDDALTVSASFRLSDFACRRWEETLQRTSDVIAILAPLLLNGCLCYDPRYPSSLKFRAKQSGRIQGCVVRPRSSVLDRGPGCRA
jgi:hypothetical protein